MEVTKEAGTHPACPCGRKGAWTGSCFLLIVLLQLCSQEGQVSLVSAFWLGYSTLLSTVLLHRSPALKDLVSPFQHRASSGRSSLEKNWVAGMGSLVSAPHLALYYKNKKLSHILFSICETLNSSSVFLTLLLLVTASFYLLTNSEIHGETYRIDSFCQVGLS